MAFELIRWSRQSVALNTGQEIVDSTDYNGPAMFTYASESDTAATIEAANYFADAVYDLAINDIIFAWGTDAFTCRSVSAIDRAAGTISTTSVGLNDSIATANIDNGAVTTAKLADDAVTSAKVDETLIQHAQVDLSLAELIGSYAASVVLVAAPGANKKLVLHRATLWIDYGGTVLANGGACHVQYDSTANGAGTKATGTQAAATLIAATADTSLGFSPVDTTLTDSTTLNKGLYLGTATADFTGGTSSVYKMDVWYSVMDVS
jgi:hypothetical protein